MAADSQKILCVVNPISGNADKTQIVQQLKNTLSDSGQLEVYKTTGEGDVEAIRKRVAQLKPERIIAVGGDGTIKTIAEATGQQDCPIGILPAGSANGLATDLEIPLEVDKAIPVALGSKTQKVDALCIQDKLGLHISDLGINAELIANYSDSSARGLFGYALNTIPTLLSSDMPYTFTLEVNGETREFEAIMLAFANSKKFGTGAMVNPNGKIDDGKFEVLIFKKFDVLEIYKTLRNDLHMDSDFMETIQTTKAHVRCKEPRCFQIDGEPLGKVDEVLVEIIPNHITIFTGI